MNKLSKQLKKLQKRHEGFTLIELLIVIVIISALAVTVFVALNPVKRVKDAHDSRRASDVETILTAIHEYIVDNNGVIPWNTTTYPTTASYIVGTCSSNCNTQAQGAGASYSPSTGNSFQCGTTAPSYAPAVSASLAINLITNLGTYIKQAPVDPLAASTNNLGAAYTGYAISYNANNLITVFSCYPEDTSNGYIYQSR